VIVLGENVYILTSYANYLRAIKTMHLPVPSICDLRSEQKSMSVLNLFSHVCMGPLLYTVGARFRFG